MHQQDLYENLLEKERDELLSLVLALPEFKNRDIDTEALRKDELLKILLQQQNRTILKRSYKRYYVLLGIFVAYVSYVLQRYGFLRHGSSFYLPNSEQRSVDKRALSFRNLFYTIASRDGYSPSDITKDILFPSKHFSNATEHADTLEKVQNSIDGVLPSELYELSETTPFVNSNWMRQSFVDHKDVARQPIYVLVPGIVSEFAPVAMFEEAFTRKQNPLYQMWMDKVKNAKDASVMEDKVFSLKHLKRISMPISKLFDVTMINEGNFVGNVVRLNSPAGSLESLGTIEKTSRTYLRRLDMFFSIMTELKGPIHIIGYSRGAAVALEMITKAKNRMDIHFWALRMKSMISVAGVLYGTPAADAIHVENHIAKLVLDKIVLCARKLDYSFMGDMGSAGHVLEIAHNTKLFWDLVYGLAKSSTSEMPDTRMAREFGMGPTIHPQNLAAIARQMLMDMFHLHEPVGDYYENVKTFKILINEIVDGIQGITTKNRLQWWKDNIVPSDVQYYAVTGTMTDPSSMGNLAEIIERDPVYSVESLDYRTSRSFYYDMIRDGNTALSDGQVSVSSSLFWPGLQRHLNELQAPFQTTILGVVTAHHWAIALPNVFDNVPSTFPREVLLKTIALYVELDR